VDTVIYVSQAGTYTVTLTNACGTSTDNVAVRVSDGFCDIFPPTAFTPNGDGRNEYFEILGRDIDPVSLQIFNRWGEIIFDSEKNSTFRWDGSANGEPCMQGHYPYLYRYEQKVGDRVRRTTYKGAVWLMR
jgi:gliding motility-associated-like protein